MKKKSLSRSCSWIFFLKGHRKTSPSLSYDVPPLDPPTTKYHGIYSILWKWMTRFPILHIIANFLGPFAFQFALEMLKSPKLPNSNYLNLTIKEYTVFCPPLYSLWYHNSSGRNYRPVVLIPYHRLYDLYFESKQGYTVKELKDLTNRSVWSKTTLSVKSLNSPTIYII